MHLTNRNGGAVHFEPCNAIVFYEVADIVYSYLSKLVKFHTVDLTSTTEADINSECFLLHLTIVVIWQITYCFLFQGLPTHDASGQELSKSQIKKLTKLYDAQAKKFDDYMKTRQNAST